ncbi:MAG: tRNA (N6-threonylcarbamoyladenosine(37)-N6)-methyltransferase TrmO [Candidatus Bathyarchaeota archaeon]|nr:MAG: tRNA (N6-threonylcarbamoyladenosine(37)-N6)-methyltransferase TrmO [Candidatus Bathyarchaeota archaeon]
MTLQEIRYRAIGTIHSPYQETRGMPIQASAAHGVVGSVEVWPEYSAGLESLEGFSHIILLYHFHLSKPYSLRVKPYLDDQSHGVFATRAPSRPNPIGLSIVRLTNIEGNILHIHDVDIVDGTPLLDIKPYVPDFDVREVHKQGWLTKTIANLQQTIDDGRFANL